MQSIPSEIMDEFSSSPETMIRRKNTYAGSILGGTNGLGGANGGGDGSLFDSNRDGVVETNG